MSSALEQRDGEPLARYNTEDEEVLKEAIRLRSLTPEEFGEEVANEVMVEFRGAQRAEIPTDATSVLRRVVDAERAYREPDS